MERQAKQFNKNDQGAVQKPSVLLYIIQESKSIIADKKGGANPLPPDKKERDMPPPGAPVAFY